MTKHEKMSKDYIVPLYMNGLQGRMLRLPAPPGKKRQMLFLYGHHSTIERWIGLAEVFNDYGSVTMPDMPGFGGMQSFYKIGEKPNLDTYADYLAAFIKLKYKRNKVTIVGFSFGFLVATRMLQRYPDLRKRVDMLVSVVGFAHYQDFAFTKSRYLGYKTMARIFRHKLPSLFFKGVFLHPLVLRAAYSRTHNAKEKFDGMSKAARRKTMDFEIFLWHVNDVRTWLYTTVEMLTVDNCRVRVEMPLWHINVQADRYLNEQIVEQHLKVVFSDVYVATANAENHAPSILSDKDEAASMVPKMIRKALAKS